MVRKNSLVDDLGNRWHDLETNNYPIEARSPTLNQEQNRTYHTTFQEIIKEWKRRDTHGHYNSFGLSSSSSLLA